MRHLSSPCCAPLHLDEVVAAMSGPGIRRLDPRGPLVAVRLASCRSEQLAVMLDHLADRRRVTVRERFVLGPVPYG